VEIGSKIGLVTRFSNPVDLEALWKALPH